MVKKYKIEEVVERTPEGTTHIHFGEFSYSYILHHKEGHRVWLGVKHGGWSFELKYRHPHFNELIPVIRNLSTNTYRIGTH